MADDDVKITVSGNDAGLLAVWQRQNAEILKNQKSLLQMGQAGEKAGRDVGGGMEGSAKGAVSLGKALTGVGTAVGGVMAVVKLLKDEWDSLISRQKEAANRQITEAGAERQALQNLGPGAKLTADAYSKRIGEIAEKTGANRRDLHLAAASAFAARGNLSEQEALESVEEAATLNPDDAAGMSSMAGANLDLRKKTPGGAKKKTGFMTSLQAASRVKNFDQLSRNIIPAVNAIQNFGDTEEEAGELVAAMSQALGDFEGAISKTASIQLASQLADALPNLKNTKERIAHLQSPQGAGKLKKLLSKKEGGLTGEIQTLPAMRGFLRADSTEATLLAAAREAVIPAAEAEGQRDALVGMINNTPAQQLARKARAADVEDENALIRDQQGADKEVAVGSIERNLTNAGVGSTNAKIRAQQARLRIQKGAVPEEVARDIYKHELDFQQVDRNASPAEMQRREDVLTAALLRMEAALKENTKAKQAPIQVTVGDVPVRAKAGPAAANDRRAQ